jgi:hypothetical protein
MGFDEVGVVVVVTPHAGQDLVLRDGPAAFLHEICEHA